MVSIGARAYAANELSRVGVFHVAKGSDVQKGYQVDQSGARAVSVEMMSRDGAGHGHPLMAAKRGFDHDTPIHQPEREGGWLGGFWQTKKQSVKPEASAAGEGKHTALRWVGATCAARNRRL